NASSRSQTSKAKCTSQACFISSQQKRFAKDNNSNTAIGSKWVNLLLLLNSLAAFSASTEKPFCEKLMCSLFDSTNSPYNIVLKGLESEAMLNLLHLTSSSPTMNDMSPSSSSDVGRCSSSSSSSATIAP
ncbi:hypothetical protein V8G54_009410, partial [Vigna mungo]